MHFLVIFKHVLRAPWRAEGASLINILMLPMFFVFVRPHISTSTLFAAISVILFVWFGRWAASGFVTVLKPKYLYESYEMEKPLCDKVCVVTGANSGIGFWTAVQLARLGSHVVITTRKEEVGKKTILEIQRYLCTHEQMKVPKIACVTLELGDFVSVRSFPQRLIDVLTAADMPLSIHCFVNNAGAMLGSDAMTAQQFEPNLACNFMAPLLLTDELLKRKKEILVSRFVQVSSLAHTVARHPSFLSELISHRFNHYTPLKNSHGWLSKDDFFMDGMLRYGLSKYGNLAHARVLAEEHPDILFVSLHPGLVMTDFMRGISLMRFSAVKRLLSLLLCKTAIEGSFTTVFCCLAQKKGKKPTVNKFGYIRNGGYHVDCDIARPSEMSEAARSITTCRYFVAWARTQIAKV